jgi:hypothetical protein
MLNDSDARKLAISRALDAQDPGSSARTFEINFRGRPTQLPVVTLTPNVLLLNHNNARLRAQLADHPHRDQVELDPASIEAQDIIAKLLRATDKYDDLKAQLRDLGQLIPGIVTRDGLLINGNTRVVALREMESLGVDVAVLPIDANAEDLLEIEMSLQMTRLVHQSYTFTNELLFMQRYIDVGHSHKQLAKKMGWMKRGEKKVQTSLRILGIVEDVRRQSETYLPYHVFDAKAEHLVDLDKEYQTLKNSGDLDSAERMKWWRISAILLGVNKDQVRTIDDQFFEEHVDKRIGEDSEARETLERARRVSIRPPADNLDDLLGQSVSMHEVLDPKVFVNNLINDSSVRNDDGGVSRDLHGSYAQIAKGIRLAADEIIKNERFENYLLEPTETLHEVHLSIQGITDRFVEASGREGFDLDGFAVVYERMKEAVDQLGRLIQTRDL